MDYCGFMGYGIHFSTNQLGGPKKVWGIREYGLLELWVKRELTVGGFTSFYAYHSLVPLSLLFRRLSYLFHSSLFLFTYNHWQFMKKKT